MATDPRSPESRSNVGIYVGAIIILVLMELVAILAINLLHPDKDNTSLTTTVTLILVPITSSILNLINSHRAGVRADDSHKITAETAKAVNGQMDKRLEDARKLAYMEGLEQAKKEMALLMTPPPPVAAVVPVALIPPVAPTVNLTSSSNDT